MNSQLDSIMKKPQLKKKYKGAKRMVVELERLDISKYRDKSIFNVQSHYCQYFKTRGSLNDKCIHRKDDHISQSICLNCDYKIEHQESLNHMAFESPVKKIQEQLEMPVFFSPTVLNDEEDSEDTTTLKNEEENNNSDDTLAGEDFYEIDESAGSKESSVSTTSSDESFSDEDYSEKKEREELKRKKNFEKLKPKEVFSGNKKTQETMMNDDIGIWICPIENVPTILNSKIKTSVADSIICYSAENTKSWVRNEVLK
jgi:hypothetical protein